MKFPCNCNCRFVCLHACCLVCMLLGLHACMLSCFYAVASMTWISFGSPTGWFAVDEIGMPSFMSQPNFLSCWWGGLCWSAALSSYQVWLHDGLARYEEILLYVWACYSGKDMTFRGLPRLQVYSRYRADSEPISLEEREGSYYGRRPGFSHQGFWVFFPYHAQ